MCLVFLITQTSEEFRSITCYMWSLMWIPSMVIFAYSKSSNFYFHIIYYTAFSGGSQTHAVVDKGLYPLAFWSFLYIGSWSFITSINILLNKFYSKCVTQHNIYIYIWKFSFPYIYIVEWSEMYKVKGGSWEWEWSESYKERGSWSACF